MHKIENNSYDKRLQRIHDAVALKEPDYVPIVYAGSGTFHVYGSGHTIADTWYDYAAFADAMKRYVQMYDFDSAQLFVQAYEGLAPAFEIAKAKCVMWPGMPGGICGENDLHQFLEFPVLEDGELEYLLGDFSNYVLHKYLPRAFGLMEPLEKYDLMHLLGKPVDVRGLMPLSKALKDPEVIEMIEGVHQIAEICANVGKQVGQLAKDYREMGYPVFYGSSDYVSYDYYSDFLRGTMGCSMDIMIEPELVSEFLDRYLDIQIERFAANPPAEGAGVFIPMHKGMDMFMSDEQYAEFYWPYLEKLVNAIVGYGAIPNVYTEGSYMSRLKHLKNLPKGKCIVHFQYGDLELVKQELGDVACVSGMFPSLLLQEGSVEDVREEAKRLIDVLAPGGGFIFDFDSGPLYTAKPENYEVLIDTIRTEGRY